MKINKRFQKVVVYGIMGCAIGIVAGLAFGLIIGSISNMIGQSDWGGPDDFAGFFGMSFGALVGAVTCSIVGLIEKCE